MPEFLLRKMYDDVWRCTKCGSRDLTYNLIMEFAMDPPVASRRAQDIRCNECGEKLPHLNERTYHRSYETIKQSHKRSLPWLKKLPLWAIGKNEK